MTESHTDGKGQIETRVTPEKLTAPKKEYTKAELKDQKKAREKIKKVAKKFADTMNALMIRATPDAHVGIVQVGKKVVVHKTLSLGGTISTYVIEVYKEPIPKKS